MIKKPKAERASSDPRIAAGEKAEQQMAFYLHRAFAADESVLVLNDLRLVDPKQPNPNGEPGACQIDHLVLHRWGAFIIESKSVYDTVSVRADGSNGDEWRRTYRGKEVGIPSPIVQARLQAEFLREFLQRNREALRGKMPIGFRTINKLLHGTDQMGFMHMPIQIIVAVSGSGNINRVNRWKEPSEPFQCFVCKADQVPDKIQRELDTHRTASRPLGDRKGDYGMWTIGDQELARTCAFLFDNHTPLGHHAKPAAPAPSPAPVTKVSPIPVAMPPQSPIRPAPTPTPAHVTPQAAVCKYCGDSDLVANSGKYGYYWKCACGKNTPMPTICHNCNTEGHRGQTVRIRKEGLKFFRCCESCGVQQLIWTNQ